MQWNPRKQSRDGHAGGGSSSSESFCPHSLCPASQRPLRWRRPGVRPTEAEEFDYFFAGNVTFDDKPLEGVTHHGRGQRLRSRDRDRRRGQVALGVPEKGEYKLTLDEDTLPEGRRRRRGPEPPSTAEFGLTEAQGGELLPRRGRRARRPSFCDQLLIRVINGLNFGLLLALAAIGLSLIFGTTGLSNFAHAEMVTFGALMVAHLRRRPGAADLARDPHRHRAERGARLDARRRPLETAAQARASGSSS